jgi:signal peptidase II
LVLGGSLSNLVDRLWYKAVLDFIELYIGPYSWPVFNVADVCIVIGIGGILLRSWRKNS